MMRFVPITGEYGRHEAFTYTRSYVYRHATCLRELGVFRWRGMQENLDEILDRVAPEDVSVVDFGGAGCPLGLGSTVVDRMKRDAAGRPVGYRDVKDLAAKADVVFSSHVLEHIEPIEKVLEDIRDALKPGGDFIVFVPSYTNEGWQAGRHENRRFGRHVWTFGLSDDPLPKDLPKFRAVDRLLANYFKIEKAEYCGDDSIYCLCHK